MGAVPGPLPDCAFYTVADAGYFPGLVALVNSLRLAGHDEPVFVTDCGLEPGQRRRLAGHATLVPYGADLPRKLAKWKVPLASPAATMVLIDADVIVLRALTPLFELAARGKIVAFTDIPPGRFEELWAERTRRPLRRLPYVNSGVLVTRDERGLVPALDDLQERVFGADAPEETRRPHPFKGEDQDVLNAVVMSEFPDDLAALEQRFAPSPPFKGLRAVDRRSLSFRYRDGAEPYVLHHLWAKPWRAATPPNHYSRLLPRLLLARDVPIRLDPEELPLRLRPGLLPELVRAGLLTPSLARRARVKLGLIARARLSLR